jgi:DNA-binding MurR/RpiR family transcriptional regulator
MPDRLPIGQRLLAAYDDMPRGERRLADLLLEDLDVVRHMTAGDLAEQAGVSKATAARLFRRLGYSGYKAAQREARTGPAPPAPSAEIPRPGGAAPSPSAFLDSEVKHLVRTFELMRADEISHAVRLLRDGEKLWVVGFGDDYPLAHFARAQLIKLRPDIRMIPIGGFPIPEEFASISGADTVLALGVGRRTQALRNVIGSAARAGARVILVTDALGAGDKATASGILRSRADGPTLFGSSTATVSLITYICALLAARIGDTAVERLRTIAAIHAEWGDGADPES